ncbi:MAG TPA: SPFH domain-containing protein, partial [Candidatus Absconditabacterales bacterium]|nr:SPFH domain-containing protein [Candidatus Absconditabacterales bacterium]
MEFVVLVVLVLVIMGVKIVKPQQALVVLRLGKISRVLREGINFTIPFIERTIKQRLSMTNLDVRVDGITRDNVKTTVELNVIFRVKNDDKAIADSLFSVDDTIKVIRAMVEEQLRAKIYVFEHDEIFGKRNEIGDEIKIILAQKLQEFGMELDSVQVKDIVLDPKVVEAMNNVIASEKNKLAVIKNAEAQKQSDILKAEADKQVKLLLGEGMALQREAIAKGFKQSIEEIKASD